MADLLLSYSGENRTSNSGYVFNLSDRRWRISHEHLLNLDWIDQILTNELAGAFIRVLAYYAETYSSAHTNALCQRFLHFSRTTRNATGGLLSHVSSASLINYRSSLDREHEWYLGSTRGFLKSWVELGYSGIDEDVPGLLDGWRLRGNIKGRAVQTLCPKNGPLSDLEFEALHQALIDAFELNAIGLDDFVLVELFVATGRRPAQIGDLKAKDLVEAKSVDGLREYILNVPRRKQLGVNWRWEFKAYALIPEIGIALKGLIEKNNIRLRSYPVSLSEKSMGEVPIFPGWGAIEDNLNDQHPNQIAVLLGTEEFHRVTNNVRIWLDKVVSFLEVPSERTGKKLRVFPTRLRRTLATRAAREGCGELIIAELLDHTDTQNARVYTENVPEHVDAINEAMARQLAPLAQAFAGLLVDCEGDAIRGDELSSRVRSEQGNVGTCGHHGFCGASGPVACYTCRQFQPWLDAPHKEVLEVLLSERKRILEITQDQTIAVINDRTILAVTEVIQRCEERRVQLNGETPLG